MTFVKLYFIAMPVFFSIDLLWIGLVARNFYSQQIGFLMRTDVNWVAAVLFYLLFIVGLVIFVITPSVEKSSLMQAWLLGGLFGLIAYSTYDLTNLAIVKNWPLIVTIVDLIWGSVLAAAVSTVTYFIGSKIGL